MFKFKIFVIFCLIIMLTIPTFASERRVEIPIGDSPTIGPSNAPITMIKFIDYQ